MSKAAQYVLVRAFLIARVGDFFEACPTKETTGSRLSCRCRRGSRSLGWGWESLSHQVSSNLELRSQQPEVASRPLFW